MTEDVTHVRGPTVEGLRWHLAVELEVGTRGPTIATACGEHYRLLDREVDVSPVGDRPSGFTGNTICYGCVGNDASPLELEETDLEEVTA